MTYIIYIVHTKSHDMIKRMRLRSGTLIVISITMVK